MYKDLIEGGWNLPTVDETDYFYLLHLFSETDSKKNDYMEPEAFFRSILSAADIKKLDNNKNNTNEGE